MISTLYRQQGLTGFYRGFSTLALRDVPGCAIYFYTFEKLKQIGEQNNYWADNEGQKSMNKMLWTMNSGGLAGVAAWTVETPPDVIKTRQQAYLGSTPLSMRIATKIIMADGGIRSLFKSMPIILARGYLVSFVALPMYEALK